MSWQTDPALMRALNCDPDDLSANRQGYLSERQRARLGDKRLASVLTVVVGVGLLTLVSIVNKNFDYSVLLFLVGLLCIGVGAYFGLRAHADLCDGRVRGIDGIVVLDIQRMGKEGAYFIYVGAEKFAVTQEVFLAFKNRERYTIYYTVYAKDILSAELHSPRR